MKIDKQQLILFLKQKLTQQLTELKTEITSIDEEIGKETKSSAGDKFETGREMMTQEKNRLEERVNHLSVQLKSVDEVPFKVSEKVCFGSLVETSQGILLFGIPMGKVEFEKESIMIVSLNSPIGKLFLNKELNDTLTFTNTTYTITAIY